MDIYGIRVRETLARTVAVKANSLEEAMNVVEKAYDNEEIVLDYRDYHGDCYIETSPYANENGIITEEHANWYEKLNF